MSSQRASEEGNAEFESNTRTVGHDSKGQHLYNVLGIDKKATEDDIKRAYRKLALKYHPDKNLDGNPEKTEKFKEVNYANAILSNPSKRKVYDELGDTGLRLMEQFGEDEKVFQWFLKPWLKWPGIAFALLTCGLFCCCCGCMCCCKCCCNFCCGKFVPKEQEEYHPTDEDDLADSGSGSPQIIIAQPGIDEEPTVSSAHIPPTHCPSPKGPNGEEPIRPTVIAMPPPSYGTIESSH